MAFNYINLHVTENNFDAQISLFWITDLNCIFAPSFHAKAVYLVTT